VKRRGLLSLRYSTTKEVTVRNKLDISRKVYASTAGVALGEIVSEILTNVAGWDRWPTAPTTIVLAFVFGYLVPEKSTD